MFPSWFWRYLHCKGHMKTLYSGGWDTRDIWTLDAGYCLDRYSVDDATC